MGLILDRGSILLSSTRTRSVELYSFSRMSSRLSINSRVANAALVFCLKKQDFKNKRQSVCLAGAFAPLATRRRRAGHREKAGCVEKLVLIFSTHILLTIKGFEANRYFCVGFSFLIFPRIFC